jgi:hypothetical protein
MGQSLPELKNPGRSTFLVVTNLPGFFCFGSQHEALAYNVLYLQNFITTNIKVSVLAMPSFLDTGLTN